MPEREKQRGARFVLAFEVFYSDCFSGVLAMTAGLVRHRWLAEEVTQEAFSRAYRDWDTVGAHPNPEAWVRRVAINLCRSQWRRAQAEARALLRLGRPETMPPPSVDMVGLFAAVDRLSRRQREVIVLRYFEDLPVAEVAGLLGVAEGTVQATLHQARRRLAGLLEVAE